MNKQQHVLENLKAKRLVKVIAGINNFDIERVSQVVRAATVAGAGCVDVAARADIVKAARQITDLPVFASSTNAQELAIAVANGADVAEIGNFDALYKDGFYLTAEDVLNLTRETQKLINGEALLSVTIPGHLSIEAQVTLAQQLEAMGVAMLQTEGASKVVTMTREVQLLEGAAKAELTLDNTAALTAAVSIPVMTASGINAQNVADAFQTGAAAVGIGSAVNRLHTEEDMVAELNAVMTVVANLPGIKKLAKVSA